MDAPWGCELEYLPILNKSESSFYKSHSHINLSKKRKFKAHNNLPVKDTHIELLSHKNVT